MPPIRLLHPLRPLHLRILFYTERILFESAQAYEKCSFNEDISKKYAALIGKAADALAGETQVYCLVIPTAYGVLLPDDMKELIPDYSDMETNISSIYAALPESVEPVPVWDKLREHSGEFIYFRTDPHWTARGAYLGYEAFCEAKGIAPIPLDAVPVWRVYFRIGVTDCFLLKFPAGGDH